MRKDIKKYVRTCHSCQTRKGTRNQKPAGELISLSVGQPFARIGTDLIGPLPRSKSGKKWITVAIDYATRYCEAQAIRSGTAPVVAKFLVDNIILRHGAPVEILSDRGQVYRSSLVTGIVNALGSKQIYTTAYRPQVNGACERINGTLVSMLTHYTSSLQKDWDVYLNYAVFAYNTARQESTGYSPFELVFARQARLPVEAALPPIDSDVKQRVSEIIETVEKARQAAVAGITKHANVDKVRYDKKRRHVEFKVGDKVLLYDPSRRKQHCKKLSHDFIGPYTIIDKLSPVNYKIDRKKPDAPDEVVHVERLSPFQERR